MPSKVSTITAGELPPKSIDFLVSKWPDINTIEFLDSSGNVIRTVAINNSDNYYQAAQIRVTTTTEDIDQGELDHVLNTCSGCPPKMTPYIEGILRLLADASYETRDFETLVSDLRDKIRPMGS